MILGYARSVMVLGLKGQGHRVNKCIFHNNDYHACINASDVVKELRSKDKGLKLEDKDLWFEDKDKDLKSDDKDKYL